MIMGDFNVTLNPKLDRTRNVKGGNNKMSCETINKFMEEFSMCDTWRIRNPEERMYTWCRKAQKRNQGFVGSRIDYVLAEQIVDGWIEDINIFPGFKTDHSGIVLKISPNKISRGKGMWKINNQILSELEYTTVINELLENITEKTEVSRSS